MGGWAVPCHLRGGVGAMSEVRHIGKCDMCEQRGELFPLKVLGKPHRLCWWCYQTLRPLPDQQPAKDSDRPRH